MASNDPVFEINSSLLFAVPKEAKDAFADSLFAAVRAAHDAVPQRLRLCKTVLDRALNGGVHAQNSFRTCFGDLTQARIELVMKRFSAIETHLQANSIKYRIGFRVAPKPSSGVENVASVTVQRSFGGAVQTWDNTIAIETPFFEVPQVSAGRSRMSVIIHELTHGVTGGFLGTGDTANVSISLNSMPGIVVPMDMNLDDVRELAISNPEQTLQVADCYELFAVLAEGVLAAEQLMPLPDVAAPPKGDIGIGLKGN